MLHDLIRLPLLKAKPQPLMAIILIVRLVLVIFDLDEIAIHSSGIEGERDERVHHRGLGDDGEGPGLLVAELDEARLVLDDLVAVVGAVFEEFGQREPLPCHLVSVVGVHELVVVDAVRRVAAHFFDGGFAAVEVDDVVDEGLACGREREGFAGVGRVVFCGVGLAGFVVFAWGGGGDGGGFDGAVGGGHGALSGGKETVGRVEKLAGDKGFAGCGDECLAGGGSVETFGSADAGGEHRID